MGQGRRRCVLVRCGGVMAHPFICIYARLDLRLPRSTNQSIYQAARALRRGVLRLGSLAEQAVDSCGRMEVRTIGVCGDGWWWWWWVVCLYVLCVDGRPINPTHT